MPRIYVRKRETKYSLEDLQIAVKEVQDKKITYRQAEEKYNVPISVIYHRIKGRKIDINRMGAGISKALPDHVEAHIYSCLKSRAQMGHPVTKEELKTLVKEYVEINNIQTPFKENKPGDEWYIRFMKRHPDLTFKKPEHLQKVRVNARKPYIVYDFYDQLKKITADNNLGEKPMYIYNCDESGFQSDPSKLRAIGEKGKPLYRVSGGSGRESTTVLACVSADGQVLPPLIVFKGAAVQARWTSEKSFPGTLYGASKNGWMEEPVFFHWLTKSFIPHITKLREDRKELDQKALLLYDGHASHISLRITEIADRAKIILMKFPSHLTDRIQPLDKCVFGPVKKAWDKELVEHGVKKMGKGTCRLSKAEFSELLGQVYVTALKKENIISGFSTTGLYPVNSLKFPKNLFNANDLQLYSALHNDNNDNYIELDRQADPPLDLEQIYDENSSRVVIAEGEPKVQQLQFKEPDRQNNEDKEKEINKRSTVQNEDQEEENIRAGLAELEDLDLERIRRTADETEQQFHYKETDKQQQKDRNIHTKTQLTPGLSSTLLNNILKQISLDNGTDNDTKNKIGNAIMATMSENKENESSGVDLVSPNKQVMQKIFGVNPTTPEKSKKVVIPRLKQCAFGEVLTSEEVKQRLKEAEEKKATKNRKTCKTKTFKKEVNEKNTCKRKNYGKSTKNNAKSTTKISNKKQKIDSDVSSNSGIEMSVHSDSDIAEIDDETDGIQYDPDLQLTINESENIEFTNINAHLPAAGCSRAAEVKEVVEYDVNSTILVRYLLKKKVEYFVGKVLSKSGSKYVVSFFKRIGRGNSVRFIQTKKKDVDTVNVEMIVKTVVLLTTNEQDTEFTFCNDEDYFYFDY